MLKQGKNKVEITGYLKENTLKKSLNDKNAEIISGYMVVAVDANTEFRIQYYQSRYKKLQPGETVPTANKTYTSLENVTEEKTTTLAKLVQTDPNIAFDTAKNLLTKVTAIGSLQEFLRLDKSGEFAPITSIKGINAFVAKDATTFEPKANFEVEAYIDSKRYEIKNEEETGRIILNGLVPEFDQSVSEISFVAGKEDLGDGVTAASYIDSNYNVGDTVLLLGDLINISRKVLVQKGAETFGRKSEDVYSTEFTNERRIMGGSPACLAEEKCFSKEDITAARVVRQEKIDKLEKAPKSTVSTTTGFGAPTAAPKKASKFNFGEGGF